MSKIRLSILLLISLFVISCTKNDLGGNSEKFSVAYISGEYDGLLLKNTIFNYLKSQGSFDQNSPYTIQANISHNSNVYITNIDNTSDRTKIDSSMSILIIDKLKDCQIYQESFKVSQFYIIAKSNKFLSNRVAVKKIKKDNTEALVKRFIIKLDDVPLVCNDQE